jgi:copper chaperone CopZ
MRKYCMKTIRSWLVVAGLAVAWGAARAAETPKTTHADAARPAPVVVVQANATNQFKIKGMHCDGCAKGIAAEVRAVAGVAAVDVSFERKLAVVAFDTNRVGQVELIRVIKEAGFEATAVRNRKEARP